MGTKSTTITNRRYGIADIVFHMYTKFLIYLT